MDREDIVRIAERAVRGDANEDDFLALDAAIREAAQRTARTVSATADYLRMEAIAGDHYRGPFFDKA